MGRLKNIFAVIGAIFVLSVFVGVLRDLFTGVPTGDKVGVVEIKGVITSSAFYVDQLKKLADDKSVKAIVVRVDSPGGVVAPCQEIHDMIKDVVRKKPVVVSMGAVATSGALYVSSPATRIVANPGTITGSIGVIVQGVNLKKLADKIGVNVVTVKSGRYKDVLNPFRSVSDLDILLLKKLVMDTYDQFVKALSEDRKLNLEEVKEFADGRIFTGRMAKELGLVDELGSFGRAVEIARRLSKSPHAKVYRVKKKKSFFEKMFGSDALILMRHINGILEGGVEEIKLMYMPS